MVEAEKLNLLFLFTDEQRYDTMAAYGNNRIEVPNLNKLAREGVVFERVYVTQAICSPSRTSILTGLYPHSTGCVANNIRLSLDVPVLPELADFKGYRKGYIGKWHLGDEVFCQHGFDEWISTEDGYRQYFRPGSDRSTHSSYHKWLVENGFKPSNFDKDGFAYFSRGAAARLPEDFCKPTFEANEASRFIRECVDEPFILYVNFLEPHMPFFGPRDNQYSPKEVTLPENFNAIPTEDQPLKAQLFDDKASETPKHFWGKKLYETFLNTLHPTEEDWRCLIAKYWGLVSQVDTAVGKILDTLRKCGLESNTVVVFTSDHGDMMGSHRLITKGFQFEEAVRVPLILKVPNDSVCCNPLVRGPVSQVDIVPTFLDYMGKPIPEELDGYSLKSIIDEGKDPSKDVFIEWFPHNSLYKGKSDEIDHPVISLLTQDGWKYNWSSFGQHELYDLRNDPIETKNLAKNKECQRLIRQFEHRIQDWKTATKYVVHRYTVHHNLANDKTWLT